MIVYSGTKLVDADATHAAFLQTLGEAVMQQVNRPFLLIRDDGCRLELVVDDALIMLIYARSGNQRQTSVGSTYVDGKKDFRGIRGKCSTKQANFVNASLAMNAVAAFFQRQRMNEYVDFEHGSPDPDIVRFPEALPASRSAAIRPVEETVAIPDALRFDMQQVCQFLDDAENDPDENIDFDDAIQTGAICGGRIDANTSLFEFSYHSAAGDVWTFEANRVVLDAIADGSFTKLKVTTSRTG